MPSRPHYASGQWNFICDMCGRKRKSDESELTWDGRRVCKMHVERRNPLDLQRGPRAEEPIPWSRKSFDPQLDYPRLMTEDGSALLTEDLFNLLVS